LALFEPLIDSGVPHIRQVCCGLRFLFVSKIAQSPLIFCVLRGREKVKTFGLYYLYYPEGLSFALQCTTKK